MDRMDIVSGLPVELRQKVFSYLSPEELGTSSAVCKLWRSLTNDDYLWKKFTPACETNASAEQHAESTGLETLCEHRIRYNRHRTTLLKWKRGDYWVHDVDEESHHAVIGNGAILVVWKGDRLKVYDLNGGSASFLQDLDVQAFRVSLSGVFHASGDGTYLIIQDITNVQNLCFKWAGGRLVFLYSICGSRSPNCKVELTSSEINARANIESCSSSVLLVDSGLVFIAVDTDIYFWDIDKRQCQCKVNPGAKTQRIYARNGAVYVCCQNEMFAYDGSGAQMYRVTYHGRREGFRYREVTFHFNETTILGVFTSMDGWYYHSAWGKDCRLLGDPFYVERGGVLHPSLPEACCYLLAPDTDGRRVYRRSTSFITKDLRTNCVLWETDIDTDAVARERDFFSEHWGFVCLSESHILYLYYDGEPSGTVVRCYVVNLKTHEVTESKIYPNREIKSYLQYILGPKIITCELSTKQSIRKLFVFT